MRIINCQFSYFQVVMSYVENLIEYNLSCMIVINNSSNFIKFSSFQVVMKYVEKLIECGLSADSIGIISGY